MYAYGARLPLKRPKPSVPQQKRALTPTKPLMVRIRLSQLVQPCSVSVRTVGTYRTSSTQTDQVFVGDKEVGTCSLLIILLALNRASLNGHNFSSVGPINDV